MRDIERSNLEDFGHQRVIVFMLYLVCLLQFSGVRVLALVTSSLSRYAIVLSL